MGLFSALGSIAGGMLGGGPVGTALGGGIGGLFDQSQASSGGTDNASAMGNRANPLAPYQSGFAQQLQSILSGQPNYSQQMTDLMSNPSSVTNLPGYQFGMDQGSETLQRAMASQGRNQSGAEQVSLQKFGQGYAGDWYNQQLNRLQQLSQSQIGNVTGAATGNALAGATAMTGASTSANAGWNQLGGSIGTSLGTSQAQSWLSGIYGGSGGQYSPQSQGAAAESFTQGWTPENYG